MAEGKHPSTPIEPGHRYNPRRASPRLFDVSHPKRQLEIPNHRGATVLHPTRPTAEAQIIQSSPSHNSESSSPGAAAVHRENPKPEQKDILPMKRKEGALLPAIPRQRRSLVLRRQMVAQATHHKNQAKAQTKRSVWAFALGSAVASLLIGAGFLLYLRIEKPQVLSAGSEQQVITSTVVPSEDPIAISDIQEYVVADGEPRLLNIKALGIVARIYPVKASFGGGPLPAPSIHDVGWLLGTSRPGEIGAALINGSVVGASAQGVFSKLGTLVKDQKVSVEMGDGTLLTFRVVDSRIYDSDAVDMDMARTSVEPGRPGLNLLTDTGRFNVRTNSFEQRRLVLTVLE